MKKIFTILFFICSILSFALETAIENTEKLYKESEKLTKEYIASCKTLKITAAKDISIMQKNDIDNIINIQEKNLETYRNSLEILKKLKKDYNSFSQEKKDSTLNALYLQQEEIKTLNKNLITATSLNNSAIENYNH